MPPSEPKSVANRELCQHFLDAYRPDRLDDLLALLHPDIEWTNTETWVEREVWCGHAEVRAGLRRFFAEWEDFSNDEVEAFSDGGDKFAVVTRMRGRSRATHIPPRCGPPGYSRCATGSSSVSSATAIPQTRSRLCRSLRLRRPQPERGDDAVTPLAIARDE